VSNPYGGSITLFEWKIEPDISLKRDICGMTQLSGIDTSAPWSWHSDAQMDAVATAGFVAFSQRLCWSRMRL
jgi:hypothetical protein